MRDKKRETFRPLEALPKDVGMVESIHQLDFMEHILPVRCQKVHLEHHHFVRGPMSHLEGKKKSIE